MNLTCIHLLDSSQSSSSKFGVGNDHFFGFLCSSNEFYILNVELKQSSEEKRLLFQVWFETNKSFAYQSRICVWYFCLGIPMRMISRASSPPEWGAFQILIFPKRIMCLNKLFLSSFPLLLFGFCSSVVFPFSSSCPLFCFSFMFC